MLPNLIVNGGMKCGTTSLHCFLGLHLQVSPLTQRLATTQDLPAGPRWQLEALPCFPFSRPIARPTLDKGLRGQLGDLFRDDVARLRAFTGQAFGGWSV